MTAEDVVEEAIQGTLHEAMDVYIPDCTFVATEVLAALEAAGFVVATREQLADAWDEGYSRGQVDFEVAAENPYREVQP